ncbi:MAG TPA: hypothetical protein VFV34_12560, partial [Blastocatellia bacterium]|nr:hypothetical protein [Blastocatellia bacterium]
MKNCLKTLPGLIWVLSALMLKCFGAVAQVTSPAAIYDQFEPAVIRSDRTEPVLFQARITGAPT